MAKLKLIKNDNRRRIGYESKVAVFILGDKETGGGHWNKSSGEFRPVTYTERDFSPGNYTPVFEGDKLEITL